MYIIVSPSSTSDPVRCPEQRDKEFGIKWPKTKPKKTRKLPCPPPFIGQKQTVSNMKEYQ